VVGIYAIASHVPKVPTSRTARDISTAWFEFPKRSGLDALLSSVCRSLGFRNPIFILSLGQFWVRRSTEGEMRSGVSSIQAMAYRYIAWHLLRTALAASVDTKTIHTIAERSGFRID